MKLFLRNIWKTERGYVIFQLVKVILRADFYNFWRLVFLLRERVRDNRLYLIGLTFEEIEQILEDELKGEQLLVRQLPRTQAKRRPAGPPRAATPEPLYPQEPCAVDQPISDFCEVDEAVLKKHLEDRERICNIPASQGMTSTKRVS
jgi:hypothetical protein